MVFKEERKAYGHRWILISDKRPSFMNYLNWVMEVYKHQAILKEKSE